MEKNDGKFPTTHWTLIARLKSDDAEESGKALEEICTQYHYPLYCYIRWRGLSHHDAQDALHDFLAKLLRLESLKSADMKKGRLRSFLATSLQRFLINRHRSTHRQSKDVSLGEVEGRFEKEEFADQMTPEKALDRTWAATVLQRALSDTAEAEVKAGRGTAFKALEPFLSPGSQGGRYAEIARTLGLNEANIGSMVMRLRERFRKHLRRRVAETLIHPTPEEIDEELHALRGMME